MSPPLSPRASTAVDLCEEYANAFRTESYDEFWARVLDLTCGNASTHNSLESTAAARLPSYRLFAEHLLHPDQSTVNNILGPTRVHGRFKNHNLLVEYFAQTANASLLCGLLLKDIEQTRSSFRPLKAALRSSEVRFPTNTTIKFAAFASASNPFCSWAPSPSQSMLLQTGCNDLLKRLELRRDKARTKLRRIGNYKHGLAALLVAVTASMAIAGVVLATHALALFAMAPLIFPARLRWWSARTMRQVSAQLDAAAKGTYILNRDLDTITRLVARLKNELEHAQGMVSFYMEKCDERLESSHEVVRQLRKIDASFCEQLDELEEHLYLCFMTINRARSLVMKEVPKSSPA